MFLSLSIRSAEKICSAIDRLLHPLMPFVTEELWQRLPSIQSKYPDVTDRALTIMLAPYPETSATASGSTHASAIVPSDWANTGAESDTALVLEAVHAARSFRVDYKVANHVKCEFKYLTDSSDVSRAVEEQNDDFITLARAESLVPLEASAAGAVPKGWSLKVVNDKLSVLMNLTGIVDAVAELARLRKEATRINEQMDQYRRKIAAPGYDKVGC
jgi:valyl-tRNA synthetase